MKILDQVLKLVRPYRLYSTARSVLGTAADGTALDPQLVVSHMAGFVMGEDQRSLLTEGELWRLLEQQLGDPQEVDRWTTKASGELLVTGLARAPLGELVTDLPVRTVVENAERSRVLIEQGLHVFGDRRWQADDRMSPPEPFEQMPLTWQRAAGGLHHPDNPRGRSVEGTHLPNVEAAGRLIRQRGDAPEPGGFDTVPERRSRHWQEEEPWDIQMAPRAHQLVERARPDIDPVFFRGDEWVRLHNMHPGASDYEMQLPGLLARTFARDGAGELHELPTRFDTLRVFPEANRAVAIWRTSRPMVDERGRDVKAIIAGLEHASSPRDLQYYDEVLRQHDSDRDTPIVRFDGELLPEEPKHPCGTCRYFDLNRARGGRWHCDRQPPEALHQQGWMFEEPVRDVSRRFGCLEHELAEVEDPVGAAPTALAGATLAGAAQAGAPPPAAGTPALEPGDLLGSTAAALDEAGPSPAGPAGAAPGPAAAGGREAVGTATDAVVGARARGAQDLPDSGEPPPVRYFPVSKEWRGSRLVGHEPEPTSRIRSERDVIDFALESDAFSTEGVEAFHFTCSETMSAPFELAIDVVAKDAPLDIANVVGQPASLVFRYVTSRNEVRRIAGMVSSVDRQLDRRHPVPSYRITIVPRVHRLLLSKTQQIFLDVSIVDMLVQKLEQHGFEAGSDYELRLSATYAPRDYITQYQETDLAFIARLAERWGIHYHFEHWGGRDLLVFADTVAALPTGPPVELRSSGDECDIYRLHERQQVVPSRFEEHDYNYRTPLVNIRSQHSLPNGYEGTIVEYANHFKTAAEGAHLARVHAEEHGTNRVVYRGQSDVSFLQPGLRFELDGEHDLSEPELLVTAVQHEGTRPVLLMGGKQADRDYRNTFEAVPAGQEYRAPRRTRWPRIHGIVTAVVQHDIDRGAERWAKLDEQGRYSLRFFYDTSTHAEQSSRWCRMLQPHAGPNYGMHFPLKPGIEVAVAFVDGDPDRPVIVGAIPNPVTPSPVTLSNYRIHKIRTVSGIHIEMYDADEPGGGA